MHSSRCVPASADLPTILAPSTEDAFLRSTPGNTTQSARMEGSRHIGIVVSHAEATARWFELRYHPNASVFLAIPPGTTRIIPARDWIGFFGPSDGAVVWSAWPERIAAWLKPGGNP